MTGKLTGRTPVARKRSYFELWKGGELVTARTSNDDFFERSDKPLSQLPLERVFAVDTESAFKQGELITDLIPIAWHSSFPNPSTLLDEADSKDRLVERFLREVLDRYGVPADRPSQTNQRRRRCRPDDNPDSPPKRDGRRKDVPLALSVWFNLPYDITRLFSPHHEIKAIHAGVDAWNMTLNNGLSIQWLRYIDKSAPQFHWMIRDEDRRLVCNLMGMDLTGYWKCSLQAASISLGGEGKDDIEAIVPNVHERAFESFTVFERDARKSYAVRDVTETAYVYARTVEELTRIDPRVVNHQGLIPFSAPSAAAKVMFERSFDLHSTVDKWSKPPPYVDQLGCDAYYGGRAFGARPGVYPCGGFRILDLKSAYPMVMALLPDPVTAVYEAIPETRNFDLKPFIGQFGVIVVSGESTDARYPAFRTHDVHTSKLRYVAGPFYKHTATIPEVVIGVLRGSLKITRVHGGVIMRGSTETSFLRRTVIELYTLKEREGKSALGKLAKLLMNSTYGKLIELVMRELRTQTSIPVPAFTEFVEEISYSLVRLDIEPDAPAHELFFSTDEDERDELRKQYEARKDTGTMSAYAEVLATRHKYVGMLTLRDFVRKARSYKTGRYFLPIYASQITGLVSAELGAMAAAVNAYCGDTDSVHFPALAPDPRTPEPPDPLAHPGVGLYFELMAQAGYAAPRLGFPKSDLTDKCTLGRWESDSPVSSSESVIVRPKVYSHRFDLPDGTVEYKQATHGFAKFTCPEAERARKDTSLSVEERNVKARLIRQMAIHEDMKKLVRGEHVSYTTRPSPRKGRTSCITGELAGEFVSREITVVNPPVFGVDVGIDSWLRWKTEAELENERTAREVRKKGDQAA